MAAPETEDAVELLTWDASDGSEEDELDELEEDLPADEGFDPEEEEEEAAEPMTLEEVAADGYAKQGPASLPQPSRARSHPDLPRIKSTSLKVKRFLT